MTSQPAFVPRVSTAVRAFRSERPEWSEWLERVPGIVPDWVARWGLVDARQDLPSDLNVVLRARLGEGGPAVVAKFQPPDFEAVASTAALEEPLDGLVRLLDRDDTGGVQLLAWVEGGPIPDDFPDEPLGELVGRAAVRLATLPPRPGLIALERWCRELLEPPFRHPDWDALVDANRARCRRLLATATEDRWVHGDLHHGNLLLAADGSTTAIDPKGLHGDPVFDACTFVRNRIDLDLPDDVLAARLRARIGGFARGSGWSLVRCASWAAAGNVLSEIWSAESRGGEGFESQLRYLRLLDGIAAELESTVP